MNFNKVLAKESRAAGGKHEPLNIAAYKGKLDKVTQLLDAGVSEVVKSQALSYGVFGLAKTLKKAGNSQTLTHQILATRVPMLAKLVSQGGTLGVATLGGVERSEDSLAYISDQIVESLRDLVLEGNGVQFKKLASIAQQFYSNFDATIFRVPVIIFAEELCTEETRVFAGDLNNYLSFIRESSQTFNTFVGEVLSTSRNMFQTRPTRYSTDLQAFYLNTLRKVSKRDGDTCVTIIGPGVYKSGGYSPEFRFMLGAMSELMNESQNRELNFRLRIVDINEHVFDTIKQDDRYHDRPDQIEIEFIQSDALAFCLDRDRSPSDILVAAKSLMYSAERGEDGGVSSRFFTGDREICLSKVLNLSEGLGVLFTDEDTFNLILSCLPHAVRKRHGRMLDAFKSVISQGDEAFECEAHLVNETDQTSNNLFRIMVKYADS